MTTYSGLACLSRVEEVRRETADAEQRAAQLEMELKRLTAAQKEREDDLERKMDALNRQPPLPPCLFISHDGLSGKDHNDLERKMNALNRQPPWLPCLGPFHDALSTLSKTPCPHACAYAMMPFQKMNSKLGPSCPSACDHC